MQNLESAGITVIVPAYNPSQEELHRCIDSISNNRSDISIIIVDDGSTIEISSILNEKDYITIIRQNNAGVAAARNMGLSHVHTKYVAFVDSDDYLEPYTLDKQKVMIEQYDADVVTNPFYIEYNNKTSKSFAYEQDRIIVNQQEMLSELYKGHFGIGAWGALYKSEIFDNVSYPEGFNSEDLYIQPDLIGRIEKLVVGTEYLYHYDRSNSKNSLSTKPYDDRDWGFVESGKHHLDIVLNKYPDLEDHAKEMLWGQYLLVLKKLCLVKVRNNNIIDTMSQCREYLIEHKNDIGELNLVNKIGQGLLEINIGLFSLFYNAFVRMRCLK